MSDRLGPLKTMQHGYKCHHAFLLPQPEKGEPYIIVGFLDYVGVCPDCLAKRRAKRAAQEARL